MFAAKARVMPISRSLFVSLTTVTHCDNCKDTEDFCLYLFVAPWTIEMVWKDLERQTMCSLYCYQTERVTILVCDIPRRLLARAVCL